MTMARRRAKAGLAACLLVGAVAVTAGPAQAATCTSVPGGTIGTDVSILGDDYRVPAITNITVCADGASAPLVGVETTRLGSCISPCLSVLLRGDDADAGGVTITWREDGSSRSQTVNPGGVGGGSDVCLLSVGSPDAPRTNCAVAIGPDGVPDTGDLVPDGLPGTPLCENVPDVYDSNGNSENFCDDPVGWVQLVVREARSFCDGNCHPAYLVCQLTSPEPWNC